VTPVLCGLVVHNFGQNSQMWAATGGGIGVVSGYFSTRQVAEALLVSESSIKRWCDRGEIETVKTLGGHRRISEVALERFLEANNRSLLNPSALEVESSNGWGNVDGRSVSGPPGSVPAAADESDNRIARRSAQGGDGGVRSSPSRLCGDEPTGLPKSYDQMLMELEQALVDGHELTCQRLLDGWCLQNEEFGRMADELIAPAFHALGNRWSSGKIDIYQERRACEMIIRWLHAAGHRIAEPPPGAPQALGSTVSGDFYALPGQLIHLTLKQLGWRATNLGVDLPVSSLLAASQELKPQLVWLSISHLEEPNEFVKQFRTLAGGLPSSTAIVVGGRGLQDDIRRQLPYTAYCDNLQQLTSFARTLIRRRASLKDSAN
jgi:excisionase family DNA binding protein